MREKTEGFRRLSRDELERLAGDELPERGRDVADERERRAPINLAPAAKVASHDSIAFANAEQTVDTEQLN